MSMRKVLFVGVVLSMALVSAQACSVSDEEFADEFQGEATEGSVAAEELAATEELAGVDELLAAEELEAVDESVVMDEVEDWATLSCPIEVIEPCFSDGAYNQHLCGARCCDGYLGQLRLYCGQCRSFADQACSGHGGPRRIRWSL